MKLKRLLLLLPATFMLSSCKLVPSIARKDFKEYIVSKATEDKCMLTVGSNTSIIYEEATGYKLTYRTLAEGGTTFISFNSTFKTNDKDIKGEFKIYTETDTYYHLNYDMKVRDHTMKAMYNFETVVNKYEKNPASTEIVFNKCVDKTVQAFDDLINFCDTKLLNYPL